ncbi:MAG TPA: NapC/NirT family cytochrome c [Planctomycetota bacterium]|nr:NapC/NirT family cytochrome c [Planctomycetota bacterium]
MDPREDENAPGAGAPPAGPRRRRGLLGALGGLLAFKAVKVVLVGTATAAVGGGGLVWYSSRPEFCKTCHNMKPYYDSWSHSSHKGVTCVACHFPPGVEGVVGGKIRGLVQVMQYFTGSEGPKPFAQIGNASCLRSGCHSATDLGATKPSPRFRAKFDHGPHLSGNPGTEFLACTACHTQILRDEHMTVNRTACHLCHNRPGEPAERSRCTLCHDPPGVVKVDGGTFDHARVEKSGIECSKCHAGLSEGTGGVPRQRCLQCHNARENLEKFGDVAALHDRHVRKETVACQDCHLEIRHSLEREWVQKVTSCETCHPGHHAVQRRMLAGEGAKGVEPVASPMFKVRTGCLSCHVSVKHAGGEVVLTADPKACESCHEPGFGDVLEGWKSFGEERGGEVAAKIAEVRGRLEALAGEPGKREEAARRLGEVESNVNLVRIGRAAHNFPYAEAVFDGAEKELAAIDGLLGRK